MTPAAAAADKLQIVNNHQIQVVLAFFQTAQPGFNIQNGYAAAIIDKNVRLAEASAGLSQPGQIIAVQSAGAHPLSVDFGH